MKWDTKLSRPAIRYGELANVKSRNVRRIVVDGGIRSEESEKCTIAGPEQLLENILPVTAARFWKLEWRRRKRVQSFPKFDPKRHAIGVPFPRSSDSIEFLLFSNRLLQVEQMAV